MYIIVDAIHVDQNNFRDKKNCLGRGPNRYKSENSALHGEFSSCFLRMLSI